MRINKSLITYTPTSGSGSGSVTSVALTAPTGFAVSGSPITSSGTLALSFASGYSLPTNTKQSNWDSAYAFTNAFPSGTAQQLLRVNTLGTGLEFFTPNFLVSTDIIATSPLVWNSTTKTMSIPQANNTTNGFLSSTDWLTFSSKQPAITLTTTGNSGASTFNGITGALNIPEYTLVGLGGFVNPMTTIGDLMIARSTGEPERFAGNNTTTRKYLSQIGNGTSVTSTSWETITGISGSGTTNYIVKFTSSTAIGNSLLFDNGTNVGINTTSPPEIFSVRTGNTYAATFNTTQVDEAATRIAIGGYENGVGGGGGQVAIGSLHHHNVTGNSSMLFYTFGAGVFAERMRLNNAGNLLLNSFTDSGERLQITGTAKITGNVGIGTGSDSSYPLKIQRSSGGVGLQVVNDSTYSQVRLQSSGTNQSAYLTLNTTGTGSGVIQINDTDRVSVYANGQLRLHSYTSTTSFSGTAVGLLAYDAFGQVITQGNLPQSGNYTPTLTGVSNVNATTAYNCQYIRVGDVVSVSGRLEVDATTANTLTIVSVSLPYNTTFANAHQCNGVLTAEDNICGIILGVGTAADLRFTPPNTGSFNYFFTLHFQII
jgi:hypothetical protein